ncbi:MIP/aquaporin family protein [Ornithinimicrobium sp.]|uniref:MIP/aquaporin family protein n=1 Tax=Ornithinimicrobium sp. TaxID=1977084 RepID=UPI0026E0E377|nr:aquaporin [Ornithinimicrobium sp.]
MADPIRKYVAEFLATFLFVFTIIGIINAGVGSVSALAIGSALMVLVYAVGHISGGHLNPAVSLAVFIRGRLSAVDLGGYVVAQLVGGALAALVSMAIWPSAAEGLNFESTSSAFLIELIFTFILCFTVLNVATSKDHPDNAFYGLAIGFAVVVGVAAGGGISGGAFNPAVALGLAVDGVFTWGSQWLYFGAALLGGALAALAFNLLNPHDREAVEV